MKLLATTTLFIAGTLAVPAFLHRPPVPLPPYGEEPKSEIGYPVEPEYPVEPPVEPPVERPVEPEYPVEPPVEPPVERPVEPVPVYPVEPVNGDPAEPPKEHPVDLGGDGDGLGPVPVPLTPKPVPVPVSPKPVPVPLTPKPEPTPLTPPPTSNHNDGGSGQPPADGNGDSSNGGNDGGNSNSGGNGSNGADSSSDVCSGLLYSNPQCCATNVLGLASLNCNVPNKTPSDVEDFVDICNDNGSQAQCCLLPIAGQALLCQSVI